MKKEIRSIKYFTISKEQDVSLLNNHVCVLLNAQHFSSLETFHDHFYNFSVIHVCIKFKMILFTVVMLMVCFVTRLPSTTWLYFFTTNMVEVLLASFGNPQNCKKKTSRFVK